MTDPGTLSITRGLPASGKTLWARAHVDRTPAGEVVRLNRDDLRAMCLPAHYGQPEYRAEQLITQIQQAQIGALLAAGVHDQHVLPRWAGWELFMRPAGDTRNDAVVKLELFDQHIRDRYDVLRCYDDRARVVAAWRSIGLTVFQVADGNF